MFHCGWSKLIHSLVSGAEKHSHQSVRQRLTLAPAPLFLVLPNCSKFPSVVFRELAPLGFLIISLILVQFISTPKPKIHQSSSISSKLPPLLLSSPKVTIFLFWVGKICDFGKNKKEKKKMADWAPVVIGVVLFVLLQPGLLFAFPGNGKQLEFGRMKTNGKAIFIHSLIFFALYAILILAVRVHIYAGWTGFPDLVLFCRPRYYYYYYLLKEERNPNPHCCNWLSSF